MLRLRLQKIGSLLGLLAILMSTLAPTISQALAAHDRLGQALATYCSADPANSQAAHDSKSPNSSAFHWQACAYCGMLAHVPVLPRSSPSYRLHAHRSPSRATLPTSPSFIARPSRAHLPSSPDPIRTRTVSALREQSRNVAAHLHGD
jgi:hypothetical protein